MVEYKNLHEQDKKTLLAQLTKMSESIHGSDRDRRLAEESKMKLVGKVEELEKELGKLGFVKEMQRWKRSVIHRTVLVSSYCQVAMPLIERFK